jgi:hypothetical protein
VPVPQNQIQKPPNAVAFFIWSEAFGERSIFEKTILKNPFGENHDQS